MEFSDLIQQRYSVRAYRSDPVPEADLAAILEAARLAPTACNRQAFQVMVLHTAGRRAELERIYPLSWFADAPIVIAVCGIAEQNWTRRQDGKSFVDIDTAIVMDHIILAATDRGLGTCWIGAFDPAAAREVLALPHGMEPILFTPLGYPADEPRPKKRKPLTDLVRARTPTPSRG